MARDGFKQALILCPNHPHILADMATIGIGTSGDATTFQIPELPPASVSQTTDLPPITWVVFSTGTAPYRQTIRIDLPVFLVPGRVDYVGAAFPRLRYNDVFDESLSVTTGDGINATTVLLADVDTFVARNYWDEFPVMLAKTLLSTAVKTLLAYGVNQNTRDNQLLNYSARIVMTIYQIQHNQADLRTWGTLPKQIQVGRVPTPSDGRLTMRTAAGRALQAHVKPGTNNLVHVRSVSPHARPLVTSASLCRDGCGERKENRGTPALASRPFP